MATNTQTTIYTAATPGGGSAPRTYLNKTYYDKNLLEMAKTKFVFAEYGQKRRIPAGAGKTVEFRRFNALSPSDAATALTEGVTPDGQDLSQAHVEVTCSQYGGWVQVSDMLKKTSYDDIMTACTDLLGEQLGTVLDWKVRDAMCSGLNVQYAGGKASRAAVTATDVLKTEEIRKAVRTLKKKKARMFTRQGGKPHFVCICSPDATYDLQNDPVWQNVSQYSNAEQIYSGEIGRLFGVVFVESTEAKVFEDGGESSADVHTALVFGKDSYGVVDIDGGGNVQSIVKGLGSAGTDDPLNQRATVGAKVESFAATILNGDWIVRIEHGVSA